jgi:hypothetical protein
MTTTDAWYVGELVFISSGDIAHYCAADVFEVDGIRYVPAIRECYRRPMVQLVRDVPGGSSAEPCHLTNPPTEAELDTFVHAGVLPDPPKGFFYGLPTRRQ